MGRGCTTDNGGSCNSKVGDGGTFDGVGVVPNDGDTDQLDDSGTITVAEGSAITCGWWGRFENSGY